MKRYIMECATTRAKLEGLVSDSKDKGYIPTGAIFSMQIRKEDAKLKYSYTETLHYQALWLPEEKK